jgi:hypothetical protein
VRSSKLWGLVLGVVVLLVAGCGGGDSGGSGLGGVSAGNNAGAWNGTTGDGRGLFALTFADGSTWAVYSTVADDAVIAGAVQGTLNGAATDFNFEGSAINQGTLTATVTPRASISGSVNAPPRTLSFSGTYDTAFEATPSLSTVAGTFTGQALVAGGREAATVRVTSAGGVSGSSVSGCTYSGNAAARSDGNAYDVTINFNGAPCSLGTSTVKGVAYYDANDRTLVGMALNAARTNGFLFVGDKP